MREKRKGNWMSLAEELLEHARFIASLDPETISQAGIRRAISTAYYAVFHLLAEEVSGQVSPASPSGLRERTQRALEHTQMLKVAKAFSLEGASRIKDLPGDVPLPQPVSRELASIANGFRELQEARYSADYDVLKQFDPADAFALVQKAEQVFNDWKVEKGNQAIPLSSWHLLCSANPGINRMEKKKGVVLSTREQWH
ncbi:hypothetical protein [Terracidiphilus sp.]|uniref:hypothetical protein n=1 Tax=Terracidiphilus sp. TaxID=1964191 RepID=UPI003C17A081